MKGNFVFRPFTDWKVWVISNLDSQICLVGCCLGCALLLIAGSVQRTELRKYLFFGALTSAIAAKSAQRINERASEIIAASEFEFGGEVFPSQQAVLESSVSPGEASIIAQSIENVEFKHLIILAETGQGKSTIAKHLSTKFGGETIVIDPHASSDDWQGLTVIGKGRNYNAIAELMAEQIALMDKRYERRAIGQGSFSQINIICDEYLAIASSDECKKIAPNWFTTLATEARKVSIRLILLTQGETGKSLNIEGRTEIKENFTWLRLGKFALKHGRSLKNQQIIQWLAAQQRPALIDDQPVAIPNLALPSSLQAQLPAAKELDSEAMGEVEQEDPLAKEFSQVKQKLESTEISEIPAIALDDEALLEEINRLKSEGVTQTAIIKKLWCLKSAGGRKYQQARQEYRELTGE